VQFGVRREFVENIFDEALGMEVIAAYDM